MTYPIEFTRFGNRTASVGRPGFWCDKAALVRFVAEPRIRIRRKELLPGWSAARFRANRRRNEAVERISVLCLDIDEPFQHFTPFCISVERAIGPCLVHTTFGSEPGQLKARIIVPLVRPVSPTEYATLWSASFVSLTKAGIGPDPSTKDPARLWFVPAEPPNELYKYFVSNELCPLDIDAVLRSSANIAETPQPKIDVPISTGRTKDTGYCSRALLRAANVVRLALQGTRHDTLRREAYSLTRLIGDHLSERDITDALMAAAHDVGLPKVEAMRVIEDSIRHRRGAT